MKDVPLQESAEARLKEAKSHDHGLASKRKISPLQTMIGSAALLVAGLMGGAKLADHNSAQQDQMLSTEIKFDSTDPANAKMSELSRTSSAILSLDSSDNRSFSVHGVLAEPAQITVNSIGPEEEVLRFAVKTGHFAFKSRFEKPVQGYSIRITKENGTPLSIDAHGEGDVLGRNEILSLNGGSEVRKAESL